MGMNGRKDTMRFKLIWLIVGAFSIIGVSIYRWETRKGCFSYTNYNRIEVGMSQEEVQALLGNNGEPIEEKYLPMINGRLRDAPPNWNKVVWGDSYRRWGQSFGEYILIGFKDGKVLSKWYWEASF